MIACPGRPANGGTRRKAAGEKQKKLATGDWIGRRQDLLITGKPVRGNPGSPARSATRPAVTIVRCSIIASHACSTHWRWHAAMGGMTRLLKSLARVELLILDDWGLAPLTSQQGRDLLEIVDDPRPANLRTIATESQFGAPAMTAIGPTRTPPPTAGGSGRWGKAAALAMCAKRRD
jgi:hypothetical protein